MTCGSHPHFLNMTTQVLCSQLFQKFIWIHAEKLGEGIDPCHWETAWDYFCELHRFFCSSQMYIITLMTIGGIPLSHNFQKSWLMIHLSNALEPSNKVAITGIPFMVGNLFSNGPAYWQHLVWSGALKIWQHFLRLMFFDFFLFLLQLSYSFCLLRHKNV